jgi:uncharacterized phage protein (TIGR01671 family)
MRDMRFRAWDKFTKKMFDYDLIRNDELRDLESDEHRIYMQFTGIYDRNKKPIYEGDIVEMFREVSRGGDEHPYKGYVKYWEGSYFLFEKNEVWVDGVFDWCVSESKYYRKVIGNIYENPELLEAK